MEDQEPPVNIDSDVTSSGSFGANNNDSAYFESRENFPTIEDTTLDLSAIIEDTGNILKVFEKRLDNLNSPRVIFTQDNELETAELAEAEATQSETLQENGGMTPLLNQSPSQPKPQYMTHTPQTHLCWDPKNTRVTPLD